MAAQDEREPGVVVMCSCLDPMVQDIPEQDIVMGEQELPPQMDPEPEMGAAGAAVHDTSPPPLYQNPPTLAESAQPVMVDMAQLVAILAGMEANLKANTNGMNEINEKANRMEEKMDGNTDEMEKMRGEMQNMGAGLQDGLEQLKIGNGELSRETCRVTEKVTETVTRTLKGEETTCTGETRRQVTEYTETREMTRIGERLHGIDGVVGRTHTHAHTHTRR